MGRRGGRSIRIGLSVRCGCLFPRENNAELILNIQVSKRGLGHTCIVELSEEMKNGYPMRQFQACTPGIALDCGSKALKTGYATFSHIPCLAQHEIKKLRPYPSRTRSVHAHLDPERLAIHFLLRTPSYPSLLSSLLSHQLLSLPLLPPP